MGGLVVGATVADRTTARAGYQAIVAIGLVASAAGAVLFSRIGANTGFGSIAAAEVVIGLGMGLVLPAAATPSSVSCPRGFIQAGKNG